MARGRKSSTPLSEQDAVSLAVSSGLGKNALVFDDTEIAQLLRTAVEREGGQVAFAERHGVDRTYLNAVLNGRKSKKSASQVITRTLGLRRVYTAE
jgi:glucokinase